MEIAGALELVAVIDGKDGEQGPQGVPGQTGPAGADAYMVSISPNSVTLECDSEGNVLDNLFVSVQPKLEKGGTESSYVLSNVSGGKLLAVADNGAIKIYGRLCKWSATGYEDLYTIKDYPNVAVGDIVYKVTNGEIVEHYYISSVGVVYITVSGVRYDRVVGECYSANIGTPAEVQFTIANSQYGFSRVYKFQVTADRASESPVSWVDSNVNPTGEWVSGRSYRYSGVRRDFCYRIVTDSNGTTITGYVVSEYWRGQGSFSSTTPPEQDNDKIVGLQKPHWKVVSYQDIGYFGTVIATLVAAKLGSFDSLVAKDCLFDNITLTGVLNNLIQAPATAIQFANYACNKGNNEWYLDPLKTGQYLKLPSALSSINLHLPITYADNLDNTTIEGYNIGGTAFTLDEMRQMIGKRIHIMPTGQGENFRVCAGYSDGGSENTVQLLFQKTESYASDYNINSTEYEDINLPISPAYMRTKVEPKYIWQNNPGVNYIAIIECKMGNYNNHECIYWELSVKGNVLGN